MDNERKPQPEYLPWEPHDGIIREYFSTLWMILSRPIAAFSTKPYRYYDSDSANSGPNLTTGFMYHDPESGLEMLLSKDGSIRPLHFSKITRLFDPLIFMIITQLLTSLIHLVIGVFYVIMYPGVMGLIPGSVFNHQMVSVLTFVFISLPITIVMKELVFCFFAVNTAFLVSKLLRISSASYFDIARYFLYSTVYSLVFAIPYFGYIVGFPYQLILIIIASKYSLTTTWLKAITIGVLSFSVMAWINYSTHELFIKCNTSTAGYLLNQWNRLWETIM